ncbi:MAG: hypothetical protein C4326_14660 [Ignavibacteria bacterium]
MKKTVLLLATMVLSGVAVTYCQLPEAILSGDIVGTRTLSRDTAYVLQGFVNVRAGGIIRIPAGTLIYGDSASRGTLIINRGGKIWANGQPSLPIVFTSKKPRGQRKAGDWGGVILCGIAGTNLPGDSAAIEGAGNIFGPGASFTRNDQDSSGVLRYVRIEFAGIPFTPNNEINGLTMGAVGSRTVIEYVQVSFANDDSFEWFGGTVNGKYLIAYKGLDDDFDTDNGYRGKLQFLLGVRDPNIADVSQSNGLEADNDAAGTPATPRSNPTMSNLTSIGPAVDSNAVVNSFYRRAAHLRRNTAYGIFNSILMGWPVGLFIDGAGSAGAAQSNELQVRNTVLAGQQSQLLTTNASGFNIVSWYNTAGWGNTTYPLPANVQLTAPFAAGNAINPLPTPSSAMLSGASFLGRLEGDPFFTVVSYRGAFGSQRWDLPWAEYDPQNRDYTGGVLAVREGAEQPTSFQLHQNYPNPFNPTTHIRYSLLQSGEVTLKVFDLLGREVATLVNGSMPAGVYETTFDASMLSSGIYFYRLVSSAGVQTRKMMLTR